MQPNENRIREYAYRIWESEGRPAGKAEQHWELARESLEKENSEYDHLNREAHQSDTFIPHQNDKVGKHAHHPNKPH